MRSSMFPSLQLHIISPNAGADREEVQIDGDGPRERGGAPVVQVFP